MLERLNHFPINWVDGMKINKNHFITMQDNVSDVVRDAIGANTTKINYGLLPSGNIGDSIKISLIIDNHKLLRVKIDECHAVTPNGARIDISSKHTHNINMQMPYPEATLEIKDEGEMILLVNITVNPFNTEPFGEPDPEENPPRIPYILPKYNLDLIQEKVSIENINFGYQLTVGKIVVSKNETYLVTNYIPPCVSASSHQGLIDAHTRIDRFFGQIEIYSIQISQKIYRKSQNNDLALMMLNLSDKITNYLGNEIIAHRWYGLHNPPAYMLDKVLRLSRIIKNFVDSKSGAGKEELLNYFAEWCGLSQADFEVLFTDLVNIEYNHLKLDEILSKTVKFIETLEQLFKTLNNLDYIGKRPDTGIFIKERLETDYIDNSSRKSFLGE